MGFHEESKKISDRPPIIAALFSKTGILAVWLPVAIITTAHYTTSHEYHSIHDILRRLYYLPIVIASVRLRMAIGLICAAVVTLAYIPHAFLSMHHFDPARGMEKVLEIILYFIFAGVAGYISDLERKRRGQLLEAFSEQRKLTGQLVRAGRLSALGEVVAGMAHEIKNPLHSLAGTAEIIDAVVPRDVEERRMWELHREEIERLRRVAERFLSFARPATTTPVSLDLRDVATRLVELVGAQARQNNISIDSVVPDKPVVAYGDLDQLAQIGINIALNAIRAVGDDEGEILVEVGHDRSRSRKGPYLRIENTGPPIDEDEMEHLFDPFHSGSDGTGLGLSISARIAEQHGGFIDVENGGLGVAFTLYLDSSGE